MQIYDCAVIGAGISGVGVALEAARAGKKVLLLDSAEPLQSTSANSLRIIHGGFRYLQKMQLSRVYRSLADQTHLLKWAREFITPLKCIMPLRSAGLKSPVPARAGCLLFCALTSTQEKAIPAPFVASRAEVSAEFPELAALALNGALVWHDALIADQKGFHSFLLSELQSLGVIVVGNANLSKISRGLNWDLDYNGEHAQARYLVNTAGAWVEDVRTTARVLSNRPQAWCKAFNIALSRQIESRYAFGLESKEGRLYFVVPRGTRSVIGTAYEPCKKENFAPPTEIELQRFITGFNSVMPQAKVKLADLDGVDFGFLPIERVISGVPKLCDKAEVLQQGTYIEVLSTKYTTFLSQGREVLARIIATASEPFL